MNSGSSSQGALTTPTIISPHRTQLFRTDSVTATIKEFALPPLSVLAKLQTDGKDWKGTSMFIAVRVRSSTCASKLVRHTAVEQSIDARFCE